MKILLLQREDNIASYTSNCQILEFEDPLIGKYLGSKHQKKLMYVVRNEDEEDSVPQPFLHSLNKEKRPGKANIVEAENNLADNDSKHLARFEGLEYKESYKIVISTYYNGKEIAETYHDLTCTPQPPSRLSTSQWQFAIEGSEINFKLVTEWENEEDEKFSYLVELFQGGQSLLNNSPVQLKSNCFTHIFKDTNVLNGSDETLSIKVWTMKNGKERLLSHVPLVASIPPIPQVMRNYASYVTENIFSNRSSLLSSRSMGPEKDAKSMSAYSFRVALLQQVAGELKNLHEELQVAATFSREKTVIHNSVAQAVTDTDQKQIVGSTNSLQNSHDISMVTKTNDGDEMEAQLINELTEGE